MFATIRREPLRLEVTSSHEADAICVPLQADPDDEMLVTLGGRITEYVSYPWASDEDDDAGRKALYQLGPPDPWMLALGALVWEGILQGAAWDAMKVAASSALTRLRALNVAPQSESVSQTTTTAW
jgi:hypothetical protein